MKMILTAMTVLALCGCAGVTPEQDVKLGLELYCVTVSEAGKQAIRDHVTAGTAVLACPEASKPRRRAANPNAKGTER